MSRLTRFTQEAVMTGEYKSLQCVLVQDDVLTERGIGNTITVIDVYCVKFDGKCAPVGCPIWDAPKEIECLD